MAQPRRTLQDIRTLAGRKTSPGDNQATYMRLCTLEMERRRREHEHRLAADRAAVAQRRVEQLTEQIRELLREVSGGVGLDTRDAASTARDAPAPAFDSEVVVQHRYGGPRAAKKKGATR